MPQGGYQRPSNPAPASGPGAMSQRTDGGPGGQPARYVAGLPYGEGQDFMDLQSSAPMSSGNTAKPKKMSGGATAAGPGLTPLNAPTENPGEPLTAGAPFGPGPGPESLSMAGMQAADVEVFKRYMPALESAAASDSVPDSFKRFVAYMRSQVQ